MSLIAWSWLFLLVYIGVMLALGFVAKSMIRNADDFATARGSYGPYFLALAFAASTASGSTFLGSPALAYEWGIPGAMATFIFPLGVYTGIFISMRLIATAGNRFGNRSIPEYLGDRYQSEGIRVLVSLLSLVLLFYLAGQLVSGVVMFQIMLGLEAEWALIITTVVLLIYVVLGGAHADILTDGAQGLMMLVLAVAVIVLFAIGYGVQGGFCGMIDNLRAQDEHLVAWVNTSTPLFRSWWSFVAIVLAHIPLGLLPHLGNKLWALKDTGGQMLFVKLAFTFTVTLALLASGGLLARAVFGDALYNEGSNPNEALPLLFIKFFPTWLAALVGVGVLSAIMSTADGLVISSSQVIANDLYRRTIAPRMSPTLSEGDLDRRVLLISRVATVVVLLLCMGMAWTLIKVNISLIIWIGIGGMMAAFAGPLVVGALWKGVTRRGAYAGLLGGFCTFIILHTKTLNPDWFAPELLHKVVTWLHEEGVSPFSCAAMGEFVGVTCTVVVSKLTKPLPESHIRGMFDDEAD
ncbi:MAG: sodium:solute symporter family protein [Planctomycetaceae bacterium]|nr:sodium:solute symporter family protein [Planctomycetaceae bacterium]